MRDLAMRVSGRRGEGEVSEELEQVEPILY